MMKFLLRTLIVISLFLAACGTKESANATNTPADAPSENSTETTPPVDISSTNPTTVPTANPTELAALLDEGDQILVWTAPASDPSNFLADATGDIAFMNGLGALTTVVKVPDQSNRIQACGSNALSPDGRHYVLFTGLDTGNGGTLYLMTDGGSPVVVEEGFQFLACRGGNAILKYSPDSSRLVYNAHEVGAAQSEFADGTLKVRSTADLSEQFTARNATSFDVNGSGVAFLQFFVNDKKEADEAAVIWWDGSTDREVATFTAKEDCKFVSGYIKIGPDGQLWVIMGENCRETEWQLYRVNPSDRSALLALTQEPQGTMATASELNQIFFSPDGSTLFFTAPDGVSLSTAQLYSVSVDDLANPTQILDRSMVIPTYGGNTNATPQISPDGQWLAFVINTPQNDATLNLLNLADPSAPIKSASAGSSGDTISFMQFKADSSGVVFTAGGDRGADNSLLTWNLSDEAPQRVRRGTYSQYAAVSPDGTEIIVMEWQVKPEGVRGDNWMNTVVVNLESTEVATLYVGGQAEGDVVAINGFVRPLLWVR